MGRGRAFSKGTQLAILLFGIFVVMTVTLAIAVAWGPKHECSFNGLKLIGCAIGSYEGLSGGLIAAAGALVAGWLAYTAAREQVAWDRSQAATFELKNLKGILTGEESELHRLKIAQGNMRAFEKRLRLQRGTTPNASCLLELWRAQAFPTSPRDWDSNALSGRPWEAVTRLRMLAIDLSGAISGTSAELIPGILKLRQDSAAEAIQSFRVLLDEFDNAIANQEKTISSAKSNVVAAEANIA